MKELKKRDMQLHMGKALGFMPYSEFLDVLKNVFYTKVQLRIDQLMEDILQGTRAVLSIARIVFALRMLLSYMVSKAIPRSPILHLAKALEKM